jgi:molybdopterin-binding protein
MPEIAFCAVDLNLFVWHAWLMPMSARNQLEGKIVEVTLGDIMAHVVVKIGKGQIESVITRRSAEQLALKKGDKVAVVIKSTEVMIEKD